MCRSRDAYIALPVEKYELVSARGFAFTTRAIAARTAGLFVTSTLGEWKTTTFGGRCAGSERLERPLAPLVGRLSGDRGALIPPRRELPGRDAADQRQHDPDGDHRPAVAGGEMGETRQPTARAGSLGRRRCRCSDLPWWTPLERLPGHRTVPQCACSRESLRPASAKRRSSRRGVCSVALLVVEESRAGQRLCADRTWLHRPPQETSRVRQRPVVGEQSQPAPIAASSECSTYSIAPR